jgi:hypothetical protein
MDADVYSNGIAVSNLEDGGVFFDGGGAENVTFTSTTHINYYFFLGGGTLYQGVLYQGV